MEQCPETHIMDSLLKECIPLKSRAMPSQPITADTLTVLGTKAPPHFWTAVAPNVWICLGIVFSSSVLTILLWIIIYRRHIRKTGQSVPEAQDYPQQNGKANCVMMLEQTEEPSWSCPHWNGRIQEVSMSEMGWGRVICKGKVEHGVPVPATELGDSALVTTKTVQPTEDPL